MILTFLIITIVVFIIITIFNINIDKTRNDDILLWYDWNNQRKYIKLWKQH